MVRLRIRHDLWTTELLHQQCFLDDILIAEDRSKVSALRPLADTRERNDAALLQMSVQFRR